MILILSNNLDSMQQSIGYESANKMTCNLLQMHRTALHMSRISCTVSGSAWTPPCKTKASSVDRQTFDHLCFLPIGDGVGFAKGYDREKAGRVNGDGGVERRKKGRQGKKEKEQKVHGKWRNQRHHPTLGSPQAHPSLPLFSYLPHALPCTTPLDYSRHSSHPLLLHLSRSFDLVSRTPSLSTSRLHVYHQMELLCAAVW